MGLRLKGVEGPPHPNTKDPELEGEGGGSYVEAPGQGFCRVLRIHVAVYLPIGYRPLSSSFFGLPYRILNINHKKDPSSCLPRPLNAVLVLAALASYHS